MVSQDYSTYEQILSVHFPPAKSKLLQATCQLLMKNSYDDVSISRIADMVNLQPANIYTYFPYGKQLIIKTLLIELSWYCEQYIFHYLKKGASNHKQNLVNFANMMKLFLACKEIKLAYILSKYDVFSKEITAYFSLWKVLFIGLLYGDDESQRIDYDLIQATIDYIHEQHELLNIKDNGKVDTLLQGLAKLWQPILGKKAIFLWCPDKN